MKFGCEWSIGFRGEVLKMVDRRQRADDLTLPFMYDDPGELINGMHILTPKVIFYLRNRLADQIKTLCRASMRRRT